MSHMAPLPSHQNLNFKSVIPTRMSHYLRRKNIRQRCSLAESTIFKITVVVLDIFWNFQDESAWLYASYGHAPSRP